jgi:hypothetical protein
MAHFYDTNFATTGVSLVTGAKTSWGDTSSAGDGLVYLPITTSWKRLWIVYNTNSNVESSGVNPSLIFLRIKSGYTGTIYITNIKLEAGNKATAWSPAPEDTLAQIEEVRNYTDSLTKTLGDSLQKQIDGVVDSWFMEGAPCNTDGTVKTTVEPFSEWKGSYTVSSNVYTLKSGEINHLMNHVGDTYTDISELTLLTSNLWQQGGIAGSTGNFYESETNISTKDFIKNNGGLLYIPSGYQFGILYFDNSKTWKKVEWKTTNYTLDVQYPYFKLNVSASTNTSTTPTAPDVADTLRFSINPTAGQSWRWCDITSTTGHESTLKYITVKYTNDSGSVISKNLHWHKIADSDAVKALQAAAEAQDTADGKRRVFTTTPSGPYDVGDLWIKAVGSGMDTLYCKTKRTTAGYSESHWESSTVAQNAATAATTAQQSANAASTAASKAQSTANAAGTAASKAQSTANTANTNATNALNTAKNANAAAAEAKKMAQDEATATQHLKTVLAKGTTDISGGLVLTNVLALKNIDGVVTAGLSGLTSTGTGPCDPEDNVLLWGGGTYQEAYVAANNDYKIDSAGNLITTLLKKDGTGKIGVFEIDDSEAIVNDIEGNERVVISSSSHDNSINNIGAAYDLQKKVFTMDTPALHMYNPYSTAESPWYNVDSTSTNLVNIINSNQYSVICNVDAIYNTSGGDAFCMYSPVGGNGTGNQKLQLMIDLRLTNSSNTYTFTALNEDFTTDSNGHFDINNHIIFNNTLNIAKGTYNIQYRFRFKKYVLSARDEFESILSYSTATNFNITINERFTPITRLSTDGIFSFANSSNYFLVDNKPDKQQIIIKGLTGCNKINDPNTQALFYDKLKNNQLYVDNMSNGTNAGYSLTKDLYDYLYNLQGFVNHTYEALEYIVDDELESAISKIKTIKSDMTKVRGSMTNLRTLLTKRKIVCIK